MRKIRIKDMNNNKHIEIQGQQTIDPIHKKGDKKPVIKAKASQNINKDPIQYLE